MGYTEFELPHLKQREIPPSVIRLQQVLHHIPDFFPFSTEPFDSTDATRDTQLNHLGFQTITNNKQAQQIFNEGVKLSDIINETKNIPRTHQGMRDSGLRAAAMVAAACDVVGIKAQDMLQNGGLILHKKGLYFSSNQPLTLQEIDATGTEGQDTLLRMIDAENNQDQALRVTSFYAHESDRIRFVLGINNQQGAAEVCSSEPALAPLTAD